MRVLALDEHLGEVLVEDVTDDLDEEVGLRVQQRRRLDRLDLGADVLPLVGEALHIARELVLGRTLGGRADDDARRLGQHLLEDALETRTLGVGKLARDAVHGTARHVHEVAARERDLAREARALVADGILRDLHEDLVARLERELDAARLVARLDGVPVHLARVQHGVAAATDVDERRFHAGQDVLHTTEIHVADERRVLIAGDVMLDEHVVFEDRDLDAPVLRAHDHLAVDGLAAGEELGLGHDGAAAAGLASIATALLLRLEAGRALDALRLGDELDGALARADVRRGGGERRELRMPRPAARAATTAAAAGGARRGVFGDGLRGVRRCGSGRGGSAMISGA